MTDRVYGGRQTCKLGCCHGMSELALWRYPQRGLLKSTNTGFLNAVLQCMLHTNILVDKLKNTVRTPQGRCLRGDQHFCVRKCLQDYIKCMPSIYAFSPEEFVLNLNYIFIGFLPGQQEDAHEFLLKLLDNLERCCLMQIGDRDYNFSQDNIVKHIFGGSLVSELRCCTYSSVSETFENWLGLSLAIEGVDSLSSALELFTCVEKLEDQSKEKQILLDTLPLVAIFHLKRFRGNGNVIEKICTPIKIPFELDVKPFMKSGQVCATSTQYHLYGFVEHRGTLAAEGQYISFVRSTPKIWHQCNNEEVTVIDENNVKTENAYILFYAREDTRWAFEETSQDQAPEEIALWDDISEAIRESRLSFLTYESETDKLSQSLKFEGDETPKIKTPPFVSAMQGPTAPIGDMVGVHENTLTVHVPGEGGTLIFKWEKTATVVQPAGEKENTVTCEGDESPKIKTPSVVSAMQGPTDTLTVHVPEGDTLISATVVQPAGESAVVNEQVSYESGTDKLSQSLKCEGDETPKVKTAPFVSAMEGTRAPIGDMVGVHDRLLEGVIAEKNEKENTVTEQFSPDSPMQSDEEKAYEFAQHVIRNIETSKPMVSKTGKGKEWAGFIHCWSKFFSLPEMVNFMTDVHGTEKKTVMKHFNSMLTVEGSVAYLRHSGKCASRRKEEEKAKSTELVSSKKVSTDGAGLLQSDEEAAYVLAQRVIQHIEALKDVVSKADKRQRKEWDGFIHCWSNFFSLEEMLEFMTDGHKTEQGRVKNQFDVLLTNEGGDAYLRHSSKCAARRKEEKPKSHKPRARGKH